MFVRPYSTFFAIVPLSKYDCSYILCFVWFVEFMRTEAYNTIAIYPFARFSQRKREVAASAAARAIPKSVLIDTEKDGGEVINLNGITGTLSIINGDYDEQTDLYQGRPTFKSRWVGEGMHVVWPCYSVNLFCEFSFCAVYLHWIDLLLSHTFLLTHSLYLVVIRLILLKAIATICICTSTVCCRPGF